MSAENDVFRRFASLCRRSATAGGREIVLRTDGMAQSVNLRV